MLLAKGVLPDEQTAPVYLVNSLAGQRNYECRTSAGMLTKEHLKGAGQYARLETAKAVFSKKRLTINRIVRFRWHCYVPCETQVLAVCAATDYERKRWRRPGINRVRSNGLWAKGLSE